MRLHCNDCGIEWPSEAFVGLRCPDCWSEHISEMATGTPQADPGDESDSVVTVTEPEETIEQRNKRIWQAIQASSRV